MRYIVDSNSFITPHRGYSPIDVARSLWSKISALASEHKIYSLDKVKEELYLHDDELKEWIRLILSGSFCCCSPRRMGYSIHGTSCAQKCWRDKTP